MHPVWQRIAAGEVLRNLRDYHIGLINGYTVTDSQLQSSDNTDIMDTGTAHRCSLQLHRVKDGNRINESRPARAPLYLTQRGFCRFIRPLKRDGIPGEFSCPSQGKAIGDIIINNTRPSEGTE